MRKSVRFPALLGGLVLIAGISGCATTESSDQMAALESRVAQAERTANDALAAANRAQSSADSAQSSADSAQRSADEALESAARMAGSCCAAK